VAASRIVNDTVKQCHSKAINMHYNWVKEPAQKGNSHLLGMWQRQPG
jgi:hypothetical protein